MTTDDLDLMQLASTGQTLARLDLIEYLAVHVVLAWPASGAPSIYCAYRDWAEKPVARLAAKEQEIVELTQTLEQQSQEALRQAQRASAAEARIAALEAQLTEREPPHETPAQNQAKMFRAQAVALQAGEDGAPEGGKVPCDHPGCLDWIKPRGMAAHKRQAHGIGILGTVSSALDAPAQNERRKCPHCAARPKVIGLAEHIAREHPHETSIVAVPSRPVQFVEPLGWRCAAKGCTGAHARDLHDPAFCTLHAERSTNGHAAQVLG